MPKQKSNRILKFIIVFLGLFLISGNIFGSLRFIGVDKVYAADEVAKPGVSSSSSGVGKTNTAEDQNKDKKSFVEALEQVNKAVYVFIWPMLAIAGISMDNDLIYGKVFNFDVALWQFWNLTKNFANYILGFVFIVSIILYFVGAKQDKFAPNKILPKLLLGGVLVQASWFILGALIDISTIATYGIGAMPLNVIKGTPLGDRPIYMPVSTSSSVDSQAATDKQDTSAKLYYKSGEKNYKPCQYKEEGGKIKISPAEVKLSNNESVSFDSKCMYPVMGKGLVPIAPGDYNGFDDINSRNKDSESEGGLKLGELIKKGKGLTGPLYALYGSFVNFARVDITTSNKTLGSLSGEFLIKLIVSIALMIPMIALAIALIMRAVFLWLIIGFAPIIILLSILGFGLPEGMEKKFSRKSILGLVFLPVTAVFGVGISLIFIASINGARAGPQKVNQENLGMKMKNEEGKQCWEFSEGMTQCFEINKVGFGADVVLDFISWVLISVLSIALMRSVVFMCLKTSEIVKGTVESFEKFASNMAKAVPILPGGLSLGAMNTALSRVEGMPKELIGKQYEQSSLKKQLDGISGSGGSGGGSSGGGVADFASVKGTGDKDKFAQAFAGSSAEELKKNQEKVLDAFNKAMSSDVKNFETMMNNPKFAEIIRGNKQAYDNVNNILSNSSYSDNIKEGIIKHLVKAIESDSERNVTKGDIFYYLSKGKQYIYKINKGEITVYPYPKTKAGIVAIEKIRGELDDHQQKELFIDKDSLPKS